MIPLAIGVAIPDEHARLTCLETNASLSCHSAAIGTAVDRRIADKTVHVPLGQPIKRPISRQRKTSCSSSPLAFLLVVEALLLEMLS
jgi:hypothetical protein